MKMQIFATKTLLAPLLCAGLLACAAKTVHEPVPTPPPAPPPPVVSVEAPTVGLLSAAVLPELKAEVATAAKPLPQPLTTHEKIENGVAADKAYGWLKNGNSRYLKGFLRKDGQSKKDISRLAAGQKPHTIVLACSDSRVPPELVFDQKLGEIFVVRTAGEALDNVAIASLEYAAEHLGPHLLVVMGHTSCGAVKAALASLDGSDAGSPALNSLVHDIHPRVASFKGQAASKDLQTESWANTHGVAQELIARSTILREKVNSGQLMIKTALYHTEHGNVDFDR